MAYQSPTAKLGTREYTQQLMAQARALGLSSGGTPPPQQTSSVAKPGALAKLGGTPAFQAPTPKPGIVPQVYSSSLGGPTAPTSSGGQRDYTQPSSQFTPSAPVYNAPPSSPASPQPSNIFSSATDALKRATSGVVGGLTKFGDFLLSPSSTANQTNLPASALQAFQQATQATQTAQPPATTAPTLAPGAQAVATTTPPQATTGTGDIKSQYQTITQDKTSDSTALQNQLSQTKALEDNQKQAQVQTIKAKIAELTAQRNQMIVNGEQTPLDRTQLDTLGLDIPYAPDAQPAISQVSAQLDALEKELASVMQDSPEYTAASEALNAKIAEEADIKARLRQGQTNIAEQPIAYSFIGGQQAALERRAGANLQTVAAQQIPLTQRLATEQAKKQSAIDVVKTKYGFQGDERDRLTDIYKTNYQRVNTLADREAEQRNKLASVRAKGTSTTKGTPPDTSSSSISQLKNALNQSKFSGPEADGKYVDPNLYLQNYQSWIASGGTAEEFFRNFPPSTMINPANQFLPSEIMQFVKKEEGRTI